MFNIDPPWPAAISVSQGATCSCSSAKHDVDDRIKGVVRQPFGGTDEVSGGVVHQRVDAAELLGGRIERRFDLRRFANVAADGQHFAAGRGFQLLRGRSQHILAPPADHQVAAQRHQLASHGQPEPRSAAGDEHRLAGKRALAAASICRQPAGSCLDRGGAAGRATIRVRTRRDGGRSCRAADAAVPLRAVRGSARGSWRRIADACRRSWPATMFSPSSRRCCGPRCRGRRALRCGRR